MWSVLVWWPIRGCRVVPYWSGAAPFVSGTKVVLHIKVRAAADKAPGGQAPMARTPRCAGPSPSPVNVYGEVTFCATRTKSLLAGVPGTPLR